MTPYAHSKQMLEADGYKVGRTEHWNSFVKIRQDLFGVIDLVAIKATEMGVLGVNPTSETHGPDHIAKALKNSALFVWLQAGNRFEIHVWRKVCEKREDGTKLKRKVWDCRKEPVTIQMFGDSQ